MRRHSLVHSVFIAVLALALVVAAGCGSSSSDSSSSAPPASSGTAASGADPAVVAMLPADLQNGGSLTVATDASYPPVEYFDTDNTTIIGMDIDLGHAIGKLQGLDWNFQNAGFDGILAGLSSGKYDVGMSAFSDNKEREAEVNFVTYFKAGTSFYIGPNAAPINGGLEALCGRKVAIEKGTTQQADITEQSKKCTGEGKPAINIQAFPDQNGANLAITSGRADIGMADSPVAVYIVQQSNGQLKLSGTPYSVVPYGIAFPKDQMELLKATQAALVKMMADGTYQQILKKWGVEAGAITEPVINGAVN